LIAVLFMLVALLLARKVHLVRLLLIEDSEKLRFHLGDGLQKLGHEVRSTGDGCDGLWLARTTDYDVIILDLMLPGMDGLSILAHLRKEEKETPVLILTAKDRVEDRVRGLKMGADDYLVKPFAFDELAARLEALGRRSRVMRSVKITISGVTIDPAGRTVWRGERLIEVTAKEFALLEFLARFPGRMFSRADLQARLWDEESEVMSNVVEATVYSLRRKVDAPGERSIIVTRRGMGYSIRSGDDVCPSDDE
jgi:DNA-binding response OmpR family regulator